jgi:hypothetical protein
MNNLAFNSQDASVVGPKVEEKVREDIGASAPVPYEVIAGDAGTVSAGSFLKDLGKYAVGGKENSLFQLHFDMAQPRPVQLIANVTRYGLGSYVGLLVFSTVLAKPVSGEAELEGPKMFGKAKFCGDPAVCAKLNANGALVKLAGEVARTEGTVASGTIKIDRFCKIVPHEGGAVLIVHTLPKMLKMGFSATTDAKQFFELASMIEAAL